MEPETAQHPHPKTVWQWRITIAIAVVAVLGTSIWGLLNFLKPSGNSSTINGGVTMGAGSAGINNGTINNFNGAQRLEFSEMTAQELERRLPHDRGIDLKTVGSNRDQQVAEQYRAYLVSHGYRIEHRTVIGMMAPPPDTKFTIGNDGNMISLVIAPSATQ